MKRCRLILCALLLSGCAVGPDFKRPDMPAPGDFGTPNVKKATSSAPVRQGQAQHFDTTRDIPIAWWELFHSEPLNQLVVASLTQNPDAHAAEASLHAALETLYAARGALYPNVSLGFAPTVQQTAKLLTSVLASNDYNYTLYTGQVMVGYTIDVFGGIRRQIESLQARAEIEAQQVRATHLTIAANVVNAAIEEAALREQIAITERQIRTQQKILSILERQRIAGDASRADIALQQAALAATETSLPPLQKRLAIVRNLLNALAGRYPGDAGTPTFTLNSLQLPGELPLSLPSTLLERRPDIRAAEANMHAANALIGVAKANRLPNVAIGFTNAGTAATSLSSLMRPDTQFWELAGILTQPLFDAGTLKHRQRNAEALYNQAAAQYRATVLQAFQNVSDTLYALQEDARALKTADTARRAAETSFTIARGQQTSGDISLVVLLTTEQAWYQSQINLIQTQMNRLQDTVALFQALGGGWQQALPAPPVKTPPLVRASNHAQNV